ncbi:MAG: GxxExxY protein [Anaerolineae bacterium]|nr:GxxExxY protein [Anaerolineae bacterium]
MPNASSEYDLLTHEIIGAAIEIHRALGPGLLESIYEDAFCIELEERNLTYERQRQVELLYRERNIGDLYADLIVENSVIVELKSVQTLQRIHTAQLLTYLKLTGLKRGLLINFNVHILKEGIKRIVL